MLRFLKQNARPLVLAAGFAVFWITFTWLRFNKQRKADRKSTIEVAIQRNTNLAVALEQYAIRTVEHADGILQLVKKEYERTSNKFDLISLLDTVASNDHSFVAVSVRDEYGKVLVSTTSPAPDSGSLIVEREFYAVHLKNPRAGLFIGKPFKPASYHKALIPFSRRLNKPGGGFGGVACIFIKPSAFTSFYADAALQPLDFISLISPDAITYARRTGSKESYGENISVSPLFQHVRKSPVGEYFAADAIRGLPTYISYRQLRDYPIIATVGTPQDEVLAHYYERTFNDRVSVIFIDLLIILFAIMIFLFVTGQRRYQRQLTRQVILAQEREREVIGRELHDNVNQVLSAVRLQLEMALADKEAAPPLIARSMQHIRDCINDIRNLSHSLTAPTLGTRSLVDAINSLVEMVSLSSGLHIRFLHDNYTDDLPMDQKLAIYRIVQEQLNNVIKHSHASEAHIGLTQSQDQTILTIRDNGRGFDTHTKRNGIGFNNIKSRVKVFEGNVHIDSWPGKGCTLKVNIPYTD
jgi:signal transduction histidine kinase